MHYNTSIGNRIIFGYLWKNSHLTERDRIFIEEFPPWRKRMGIYGSSDLTEKEWIFIEEFPPYRERMAIYRRVTTLQEESGYL